MYTVVDKRSTILIDYSENSFHVKDLFSGDSQVIPETFFCGNTFKYPSDFMMKFLKKFSGKYLVIFTLEAEAAYIRLMNANREGIYD